MREQYPNAADGNAEALQQLVEKCLFGPPEDLAEECADPYYVDRLGLPNLYNRLMELRTQTHDKDFLRTAAAAPVQEFLAEQAVEAHALGLWKNPEADGGIEQLLKLLDKAGFTCGLRVQPSPLGSKEKAERYSTAELYAMFGRRWPKGVIPTKNYVAASYTVRSALEEIKPAPG